MSNTVRVRVPVMVGHDGRWHAEGWDNMKDLEKSNCLNIMLDVLEPKGPWIIHWIEADLPLPAEEVTVQAVHQHEEKK